jgi:Ca2+-binding RTX toxin-like protein
MKTALVLALTLTLLAAPAAAQAGEVTIASGVLKYTAAPGAVNDDIQFRRIGNNIEVSSPGTTPLTENSANCNPPVGPVVLCPGVVGAPANVNRVLAVGLDGNDSFAFSDLGSNVVGEADLGPGVDTANVIDQAQPFALIARGGAGTDTLMGGVLGDTLDGGPDTDNVRGYAGPDDLIGGGGIDEVRYDGELGRSGRVLVSLDNVQNDGNEAVNERDNVHSDIEDIHATAGNDVLTGSSATNIIRGYGGGDQITGGAGVDLLFGDGGMDTPGNDTILARDGNGERVDCGGGTDKVVGDATDTVSDCETVDRSAATGPRPSGALLPGACANVKRGTGGANVLTGTSAGDRLLGRAGNDRLRGLAGDDCLFGEAGRDSLSGGSGKDRLSGGGGNDKLSGGSGADKLSGGSGKDSLTGGSAKDSFSAGSGNDKVSARDGVKEAVNCGSGKKDRATVDKKDKVKGCERVKRR